MALEIAIDEMAEKVGMDPIEFRILNDTQVDPEHPKRKFSHRDLVGCMRLGAEKFGWGKRGPIAAHREGGKLIGIGMAAAFRNNLVMPSGARVKLDAQGKVTVETDMTDIGTGSYTIIAQTAAEMMGVPMDKVGVHLGDSRFPVSSGSGGQFGANSSTSGVMLPVSSCERPSRRNSVSILKMPSSRMVRCVPAIVRFLLVRQRGRPVFG